MDEVFILIDKPVYRDNRLPARAMLLYGLIQSLSKTAGFCWATNSFLANELNISKGRVSHLLSKLNNCKYIAIKTDQQSEQRRIYPLVENSTGIAENSNTPCQKQQAPIAENSNQRITKREKRESKRAHKVFQPPTVKDVQAYCAENRLRIDAGRFVNYYQAQGWKRGRAQITDWRPLARNWANSEPQGDAEMHVQNKQPTLKDGGFYHE